MIRLDLKAGMTIQFVNRTYPKLSTIWKIDQIVARGAVVTLIKDGSHKHLIEWHKLEGAEIVN